MKKLIPSQISSTKSCSAVTSTLFFTTILLFTAISVLAGGHKAGKPFANAEKKLSGGTSGSPPTVSYTGGVQTYTIGTAITSIAPTSSGVAAFGNWGTPTILDLKSCNAVTIDKWGNIFYTRNITTDQTQTDMIKKIPAGGGATVVIGHDMVDPFTAITTDTLGNLYVADPQGLVYELDPVTGAIISQTGYYSPFGVALDNTGHQIVADSYLGVVSNHDHDTVSLILPVAIALDANQNIYVCGTNGSDVPPYVYKFGPGLTDSVLLTRSILYPAALAVDRANNVYVANSGLVGKVVSLTGSVLFSPGSNGVAGVAIDSVGNMIVTGRKLLKAAPIGGYFISPSLPSGLSFNSNTGTISGTPIATSPSTTYTITAYNRYGSASAKVIIKTSTDQARLANLSINPGTLAPPFAFNTKTYTTSLPHADSVISITPTVAVSGATVKVNGTLVASGTASANIPLIAGANAIPVIVTAPDGITTDTYTVTASRTPQLDQLVAGIGPFYPNFSPTVFTYVDPIPYGVGGISLTPTVNDTTERITINGVSIASGRTSANIATPVGNDTIKIIVTARDGSLPVTYNFIVQRAPLPPTLSYPGQQTYTSGTAITPLTPSGSRLKNVFGFSPYPPVIQYDINSVSGTAVDSAGNVFCQSGSQLVELRVNTHTRIVYAPFSSKYLTIDKAGNLYTFGAGHVFKFAKGSTTPVIIASGLGTITALASDPAGDIYTADPTKTVITVIPAGGGPISTINIATHAQCVTADDIGNIYFGDTNSTIYKYSTVTGQQTTLQTLQPQMYPYTIAVDANYSVFVGLANSIYMINAAGTGSNIPMAPANVNQSPLTFDNNENLYFTANGVLCITAPSGGFTVQPALPKGLGMDINTGVISGTPTVGSPAMNYKVTAFNSGGSATANVNIKVISAISTLSGIITSSGTLSPAFATTDTTYKVYVSPGTGVIKLTPTASVSTEIITVSGKLVPSGVASAAITLATGNNVIPVVATAQNRTTTTTYTVTVIRLSALSENLANLVTNDGPISPAFSANTTSYSLSTTNSSIRVTPVLRDTLSSMTVNGVPLATRIASAPIALNPGPNIINIVVTAEDGVSTRTYTLTVNMGTPTISTLQALSTSVGTLSPSFASSTKAYNMYVSPTTSSITVTPIVSYSPETVTVNGVSVASGAASAAIALASGANTITTIATAQNGTSTTTYTINVTRITALSVNLAGLICNAGTISPAFSSNTTNYTVSTTRSTATVTLSLRDTLASAKVNGTALANKTASAAIPLSMGANTITIVVTAEDGVSTKTYTLAVTRTAAGSALFANGADIEPLPTTVVNIIVHTALSPNGDGIDDHLTIDGISAHPDNTLSIMDGNGALVYTKRGYDNATDAFDGHASNGKMQKPGTYYYVLRYKVNNEVKVKSGYVVLKY